MAIDAVTNPTTTTTTSGKPATPTTGATSGSKPKISSDFETFLKMLTTQMKNQDPMNPIESADYAVQLATFSGVEQQVRTNDLLEAMTASLGATGLGQLANWVGMDVRVAAPAYHDGRSTSLMIEPKTGADKAVLVFTDANGRDLGRAEIAPVSGGLTWPAEVKTRQDWPPGVYGFRLESWDGDKKLGEDAVPVYARVTEAQIGKKGTELVLRGGIVIEASKVTAMRQPPG
ncbi:flagellar hook capping FlgD N-terminal domain-containing protein [Paracoccus sp. p4-l81]|uniref:flagellar hook capping FlgD N-terminal domain-containing protein n=1 Tax=Paracoccus sp. p4-l81 TaxID=3342806 RepID=UPI0035B80CD5